MYPIIIHGDSIIHIPPSLLADPTIQPYLRQPTTPPDNSDEESTDSDGIPIGFEWVIPPTMSTSTQETSGIPVGTEWVIPATNTQVQEQDDTPIPLSDEDWSYEMKVEDKWRACNDADWYDYHRIMGEMIGTRAPFARQSGKDAQEWRVEWFEHFFRRQAWSIRFHRMIEEEITERVEIRGEPTTALQRQLNKERVSKKRQRDMLLQQNLQDIEAHGFSFMQVWGRMFTKFSGMYMSDFEAMMTTNAAAVARDPWEELMFCGTERQCCTMNDEDAHNFFDAQNKRVRLYPPTTSYNERTWKYHECAAFTGPGAPYFPAGMASIFYKVSLDPVQLPAPTTGILRNPTICPPTVDTTAVIPLQPTWPGHTPPRRSLRVLMGSGPTSTYTVADIACFYGGSLLELKSLAEMFPAKWKKLPADNGLVRIGQSTRNGGNLGLFAVQDIKPWKPIEPYRGVWTGAEAVAQQSLSDAIATDPGDHDRPPGFIIGDKETNFGAYANDPLDDNLANVRLKRNPEDNNNLWMYSLEQGVPRGRELLLPYGEEYWVVRTLTGHSTIPFDVITAAYGSASHLRRTIENDIHHRRRSPMILCIRHTCATLDEAMAQEKADQEDNEWAYECACVPHYSNAERQTWRVTQLRRAIWEPSTSASFEKKKREIEAASMGRPSNKYDPDRIDRVFPEPQPTPPTLPGPFVPQDYSRPPHVDGPFTMGSTGGLRIKYPGPYI